MAAGQQSAPVISATGDRSSDNNEQEQEQTGGGGDGKDQDLVEEENEGEPNGELASHRPRAAALSYRTPPEAKGSDASAGAAAAAAAAAQARGSGRPVILITEPKNEEGRSRGAIVEKQEDYDAWRASPTEDNEAPAESGHQTQRQRQSQPQPQPQRNQQSSSEDEKEEEQFEEVDGISYRIVAAVTTKARRPKRRTAKSKMGVRELGGPDAGAERGGQTSSAAGHMEEQHWQSGGSRAGQTPEASQWASSKQPADGLRRRQSAATGPLGQASNLARNSSLRGSRRRQSSALGQPNQQTATPEAASGGGGPFSRGKFSSMRRKSSAFVSNLLTTSGRFLEGGSKSNQELSDDRNLKLPQRRMSIYEMTKSPPPETSIEMYLNERRRSSTVSVKFVQQQLEQQSTFETNYQQRQQYFKDLNEKLINQDRKLLNVVANRGPQIHRHSVDIAQLPLQLAQMKASGSGGASAAAVAAATQQAANGVLAEDEEDEEAAQIEDKSFCPAGQQNDPGRSSTAGQPLAFINQNEPIEGQRHEEETTKVSRAKTAAAATTTMEHGSRLASISEHSNALNAIESRRGSGKRHRQIVRKFRKLDASELTSTPAPDVKIGQRVAYKEYYGNEFGTIRWIGRVPQISADWTVGVEFDNAIGEGDGSLHGRRYFIAKDCFAKFLPLDSVAQVDQHVGRPEPGTMISVMSASVRPGQMISIQRVSTVHVQHCFLNAPHRRLGAEFLGAVNTRLHCQCPNCGPCAHVVKPPRTERLKTGKNATHMCQFSTYTCCGMESQETAMCTYTGNKISSTPPPMADWSGSQQQHSTGLGTHYGASSGWPPIGNSWIEGSGYLASLQAAQSKLMPPEYRLGAAPEDIGWRASTGFQSGRSSRQSSGKRRRHRRRTTSAGDFEEASPNQTSDQCCWIDGPACCGFVEAQRQGSELEETSAKMDQKKACESGLDSDGDSSTDVAQQYCTQLACPPHEAAPDQPETPIKPKYRDSIENRYLFPTDSVLDPTLEADLETLSQARYGNQLDGATPSGQPQNNHSRNYLLKSLRSLVSCLVTGDRSSSQMDENNAQQFEEYNPAPTVIQEPSSNYHNKKEEPIHSFEGPPPNTAIEHFRRHLSSISSDCGFSSDSHRTACSLAGPKATT